MKKKIGIFICLFICCFFAAIGNSEAKRQTIYCNYSKQNELYEITFIIDGTEIEMNHWSKKNGKLIIDGIPTDLTLVESGSMLEGENYKDSKGVIYKFNTIWDAAGHKVNSHNGYCPSSINVDVSKNKFTWITDSKGDYKYIKGSIQKFENEDGISSCPSYRTEKMCQTAPEAACMWNEEYGFCNVNDLTYLKCGTAYDIPKVLPWLTSFAVTLLKVATPIILIVVSILTLLKAIAAQKEDEIKKAQGALIKKIVASVMIFFIISIVQFVILKVGEDEKANITSCLNCFLNNQCEGSSYFKDGYGTCHSVDYSSSWECEDA